MLAVLSGLHEVKIDSDGKRVGAGLVPARLRSLAEAGRDKPCPYWCPDVALFVV